MDFPQCLGVNGKITAGADTELGAWSLGPQPDGTLRGVDTATVLTNECAGEGLVVQVPLVATRTGDRPTGVTVADPAGLTAAPSTSTPAPPAAGPVLDGTYRFDFDFANQTVNGAPTTGGSKKESHWWAFRSSCTSTRCVAAGAQLEDDNQQEASGEAEDVVQFTNGRWQDTPTLQAPAPCDETGNGTATYTGTMSWSLQSQTDGTLRGAQTMTVLTSQCGPHDGVQGDVYNTPVVVTRVGDVPPSVVLADPTLFQ